MENIIKETIINPGRAIATGLVFAAGVRIFGQKKPGNIVLAGLLGVLVAPFIIKTDNQNGQKITAIRSK